MGLNPLPKQQEQHNMIRPLLLSAAALIALSTSAQAEIVKTSSIAMHGTPKYAENFTHFGYTNPEAPKGGKLKNAAIGTFDSLNPFINFRFHINYLL